jgi:glycosyltransferase involved in cell wall biosynthesis
MPYSLIESLRAGVPIVATNVIGNNEVVSYGINGELFPIGDVDAGKTCVLNLLKKLPSKLEIRNTYLNRFTLDEMVEEIERQYEGNLATG